jgi:hypothetical protein
MTNFERKLNILFGNMVIYENDPGFGYQIFRLKEIDNARIFRVARQKGRPTTDPVPPTKGPFVNVTIHPILRQVQLNFCSFPKGSDGSLFNTHAAIAYADFEMQVARKDAIDFLSIGLIPKADDEPKGEPAHVDYE